MDEVGPSYTVKTLLTLPDVSCSTERSFSGLKKIETTFRSAMTKSRLTGLMLLHKNCNIPFDIQAAIDTFARMHLRRMRIVKILEEQHEEH